MEIKKRTLDIILAELHKHYDVINVKIKTLNYGGCGIFAVDLYDVLIELGYKPQLVIFTNDKAGMKCRIAGKPYAGYASVRHMVVRVGKFYVDSMGFNTNPDVIAAPHLTGGYEIYYGLPIEVARKWNSNPHQWNEKFKRKNIPTVKKILVESKNKLLENLVVSK